MPCAFDVKEQGLAAELTVKEERERSEVSFLLHQFPSRGGAEDMCAGKSYFGFYFICCSENSPFCPHFLTDPSDLFGKLSQFVDLF